MFLVKKVKRKKSLLLSLLLATGMLLTACGQQEAPNPSVAGEVEKAGLKKAKMIIHFKTGSLDPHNSFYPLKYGVTETLVRMDENLEVKPWLASKWEAIDERTWTFTIRDGVTFQDGTKLDAAAAKASFERGVASSPALARALKVESMKASGQELTFVTTEPHPSLPSELVNPFASVVQVEAEKQMGTEAFNLAPVGTGPFKVKQFQPNVKVDLVRYDGYWDGKAKLDEIEVAFNEDGNVRAMALQSKEADIVYQIPAETVSVIQQDPELRVESVPSLRVHFLLYNQQKPLLQDIRVRRAIDLLLDRNSIVNDILLGNATAANGPFHHRLPFGSKDEVRKPNSAEAKKMLEEAGYKRNAEGKWMKDGQPLSMQIITYKGRPELPLIAQLLQSEAAKIGMKMEIKTVENVDQYLRDHKDWDVATYSNSTSPRGDGGFYLNSAFMPGGSLNPINLGNKNLIQVVTQLNATADIQQRVKLTQQAVDVINREVLHSFLVYPNMIVGVNNRVLNWKPGAEDYYYINNKMDVK